MIVGVQRAIRVAKPPQKEETSGPKEGNKPCLSRLALWRNFANYPDSQCKIDHFYSANCRIVVNHESQEYCWVTPPSSN
jgi:hypothetical protein